MQMWRVHVRNHPTVGPWVLRAERHPGWVWKAALLAMVLTIVVPLLMLTVAALLVGFVAFILFGAVPAVIALLQRIFGIHRPRDASVEQGRVNVRVISDDQP